MTMLQRIVTGVIQVWDEGCLTVHVYLIKSQIAGDSVHHRGFSIYKDHSPAVLNCFWVFRRAEHSGENLGSLSFHSQGI